MKRILTLLLVATLSLTAFSKDKMDKIAIAEPEAKSGVSLEDISGISDYLEAKLAGNYELFSRGALKQMLKEYEFNQSGMILDDEAQTELNQKAVKYLFTYSISKMGNTYSMPMMIIDSSTGKINGRQRTVITAPSLNELFEKIDIGLEKMGVLLKSEEDNVKTLAIFPVKVSNKVSAQIGEDFYSKFGSFLLKSDSFDLVNRNELKSVLSEYDLAKTNAADSGQLNKINQLKIADYIILSEINRFENYQKSSTTTIAGTSSGKNLLKVQIQLQIIEVKTGKIIAQENINESMDSLDVPIELRRNFNEKDFDNYLLDKAVETAGNILLERLNPVLVADIDGDSIILSRGQGAGIVVGKRLQVYNPGKTIINPKTKKILGTSEKLVGELEVIETYPNMSTAKLVKGGDVQVGAVCRVPQAPPITIENSTETPNYPMAN